MSGTPPSFSILHQSYPIPNNISRQEAHAFIQDFWNALQLSPCQGESHGSFLHHPTQLEIFKEFHQEDATLHAVCEKWVHAQEGKLKLFGVAAHFRRVGGFSMSAELSGRTFSSKWTVQNTLQGTSYPEYSRTIAYSKWAPSCINHHKDENMFIDLVYRLFPDTQFTELREAMDSGYRFLFTFRYMIWDTDHAAIESEEVSRYLNLR